MKYKYMQQKMLHCYKMSLTDADSDYSLHSLHSHIRQKMSEDQLNYEIWWWTYNF